ncbi:MAG: GFA family protein [Alphaproteobacteria bacterium]
MFRQAVCRCGAVRYELQTAALPRAYACHCLDCQTWTGSAFSVQFPVAEAALTVQGPLAIFELITPSGNTSRQRVAESAIPVSSTRTAPGPGSS